MKKTTILITGAGAPGIAGTIYSLRNNSDGMEFRIITTDIKKETVGQYLSDGFYQLPAPEHEDYLHALLAIIKQEMVDVVIPQTTREIDRLSRSESKDHIRRQGAKILVSDYHAIEKANDKYLVLKECGKGMVPFPEYHLVNTREKLDDALDCLQYPAKKVVIKPRCSNGMRGLRILTEEALDIDSFLNEKPTGLTINKENLLRIFSRKKFPEMIVSEYLPGDEYTVDVFRGANGMIVIPRLRKQIRSGISFHARVDLRKDLIEYSKKLSECLDLKYCFGFQFKLDYEGTPKILESNPRVQGTMVTSLFAGFNMIYASVKELLGHPVSVDPGSIKDGVEFMRYWGGVGIHDAHILGNI